MSTKARLREAILPIHAKMKLLLRNAKKTEWKDFYCVLTYDQYNALLSDIHEEEERIAERCHNCEHYRP